MLAFSNVLTSNMDCYSLITIMLHVRLAFQFRSDNLYNSYIMYIISTHLSLYIIILADIFSSLFHQI